MISADDDLECVKQTVNIPSFVVRVDGEKHRFLRDESV